MQAPPSTRQRTFAVDGKKIRIRSRRITRQANHVGWSIDINGKRTRHFTLTREEAEDIAFVQWVNLYSYD